MTPLAGNEVTEMSLFVIVAVLEELGCFSQPPYLLRPLGPSRVAIVHIYLCLA